MNKIEIIEFLMDQKISELPIPFEYEARDDDGMIIVKYLGEEMGFWKQNVTFENFEMAAHIGAHIDITLSDSVLVRGNVYAPPTTYWTLGKTA